MTDKSVLGDLPEGVESAMFLRDGWPDAVVCKVIMKNGCIGIGIARFRVWITDPRYGRATPADADAAALLNAIANVSATPPDYTEVQKHVVAMQAAAEAKKVF